MRGPLAEAYVPCVNPPLWESSYPVLDFKRHKSEYCWCVCALCVFTALVFVPNMRSSNLFFFFFFGIITECLIVVQKSASVEKHGSHSPVAIPRYPL